jgi:riboflavin kinase/FMN adenylyltransferase
MRLTILGGGGFRVPLIYRALLADRAAGRVTHLTLHDLDASRLTAISRVLRAQAGGVDDAPRVSTTTDLTEALTGADFVFFAVRVHGLASTPLTGVASLGVRPTVDDSGRVLLETHCFDWPAELGAEGGYGKIVRVELLHKLRDEARYDGLEALTEAIRLDARNAQDFLAAHASQRRQTTRDRI